MSLNDLYAQYDRPNCCKQGDKYIWWSINETGCEDESKRGFTWWVMETPFSQGQSWIERVNHCPFCGYDLGFGKLTGEGKVIITDEVFKETTRKGLARE